MDRRPYIAENITVLESMRVMDQVSLKVLFVMEDDKLAASLTDGDIRRWLLAQGDMQACVKDVANYHPMYLKSGDRNTAFQFMREHGIDAVPIVDDEMHVVEVVAWHEYAKNRHKKDINIPVIMMAGGRGSRLFPYTKVLPKPLIPIGEIPISEHIIRQFYEQGCDRFYLVVNHKKNMIKAYYNETEHEYHISFIDEEIPLGTGGGLSLLKGHIHETCILTNCDILIREDFSKILSYHREQRNKITMICSAKGFHIPYGVVHIREGGEIDYMEEKPEVSFFTNTGCYIIEPEVIDEMQDNTPIGFPEVIERCKNNGDHVGIFPIGENAWLDMGQMEEMENMRKKIEDSLE